MITKTTNQVKHQVNKTSKTNSSTSQTCINSCCLHNKSSDKTNFINSSKNKLTNYPKMARQLQMMHPSQATAQVGMAGVSLLLCAFALFMCASHARKWRRRWNACLDYGYEFEDPVIELNQEATVMTTQRVNACVVNATESENVNDEMFFSREQQAAIWQKNILMGGKCQLPDFSGVILYDPNGNAVTPAKTPRPLLTWK
ncbi:uncharacterized protein LOC120076591 [Benincasa hispida]|uniref:uncharacterized protein LOC120076591 n=1 Tax=Benincasa hispida TaxID=102211 RepID=UPI0018FFFC31|nr:uncharacterized protein LOC120076591 [Benincasa hispida]